jgi:hypothetical protein
LIGKLKVRPANVKRHSTAHPSIFARLNGRIRKHLDMKSPHFWRQWLCAAFIILQTHAAKAAEGLQISWTNNLLTLSASNMPGGKLDIWYLEAFCRKGAHHQNWNNTTLPHKTTLLESDPDAKRLKLRTTIGDVEMIHVLRAADDEIDIQYTLVNHGKETSAIEWFQPACIRVAAFTGCAQSNYTAKSFIFTDRGLTTLDKTRRTEDALYRGGQVYVPKGINLEDANPRPLCLDSPTNGLIGCVSADNKYLLATAFDSTHELFEGVYVCLHSDPHVGGLKPGEIRHIHGKIYFLKNNVEALLKRYKKDFRQ